jgi:hypothetical protein
MEPFRELPPGMTTCTFCWKVVLRVHCDVTPKGDRCTACTTRDEIDVHRAKAGPISFKVARSAHQPIEVIPRGLFLPLGVLALVFVGIVFVGFVSWGELGAIWVIVVLFPAFAGIALVMLLVAIIAALAQR